MFYFSEEKPLTNLIPYVGCKKSTETYISKFFQVNYPIVFYEIPSVKFCRFLKKVIRDKSVYLCGSGGLYLYQKFPQIFENRVIYIPIARKRDVSGRTIGFLNRLTGKDYLGEYVTLQEGDCEDFVLFDDVYCSGSTVNFLRRFYRFDAVISVLASSKNVASYFYIKEINACSYLLWDILKTGGVYG